MASSPPPSRGTKHRAAVIAALFASSCLTFIPHATDPRPAYAVAQGDITAAAFGPIYNYNSISSATESEGDTFFNAWGADDTNYVAHDDGHGFSNSTGFPYPNTQLMKIDGNPNYATSDTVGTNLNPGSLGNTMPQTYGAGMIEVDGILYKFAHYFVDPPPYDYDTLTFAHSSLLKSSDGGVNWYNAQGELNTPPPNNLAGSAFTDYVWGFPAFINYGRGGEAPNVDGAQTYVYMVSHDNSATNGGNPRQGLYAPTVYLSRIARSDLPNLNANQSDIEFWTGGGWSTNISNQQPILTDVADVHVPQINYDYALQRYVMSTNNEFFPNGGTTGEQQRLGIYTAPHPWGPWTRLLSYAEPYILGGLLVNNKWTTPDGRKMWWISSGAYNGNYYPYGVLYHPVYLSTGTVDTYQAESAGIGNTSVATSYDNQYTGSGYLTGFSSTGDGASFTVNNVEGTGWHILKFRYASTNTAGNTASAYVNGTKVARLTLPLNDNSYKASHNWTEQAAPFYLNDGSNIVQLKLDSEDSGSGLLLDSMTVSRRPTHDEGRNVAVTASPTVSDSASGYSAAGINDGMAGQADTRYEWSSGSTGSGGWAQLTWSDAVTLNKIVLFDRPASGTAGSQVTSGTLSFSDRSTVPVGKLQDDGGAGTVVTFTNKTVTSVRFTITGATGTADVGLSEFQAYSPGSNYVDDDAINTNLAYSTGWSSGAVTGFYDGSAHWSNTANATLTYDFVGTNVTWIGGRGTTHGKAEVYIDGVLDQTVDTYADINTAPSAVYTKTGLSSGSHTMTIKVLNTRHPDSTDYYTDVDALCTDCGHLANDTSPGIDYSGSWGSGAQPSSLGGDAHWSNSANATTTISFYGSNISWIGGTGSSHGRAEVWIDGVLDTEVDTYSANPIAQTTIYTKRGLAVGQHTLQIKIRSDKNPAASDYYTDVDAFVYSS